jgi:hypothetical protein
MSEKVLLKDVDGSAEFIERVVDSAADIALVLAGHPDELARDFVKRFTNKMKKDLADQLGADAACELADSFGRAVLAQKIEIERGGSNPAGRLR